MELSINDNNRNEERGSGQSGHSVHWKMVDEGERSSKIYIFLTVDVIYGQSPYKFSNFLYISAQRASQMSLLCASSFYTLSLSYSKHFIFSKLYFSSYPCNRINLFSLLLLWLYVFSATILSLNAK